MPASFVDIDSISLLHELCGTDKPQHPLISLIDSETYRINREETITYRLGLYTIFCKNLNGTLNTGDHIMISAKDR